MTESTELTPMPLPWPVIPNKKYKDMGPEELQFYKTRRRIEEHRKAEAKKLATLQGFQIAHQKQASNYFADKLGLISAMLENVRDEVGAIDPSKVALMDPKIAKLLFDEIARVEKTAGFAAAAKTEVTHKLTLAEEFAQLSQGDVIDAEDAEIVDDDEDDE